MFAGFSHRFAAQLAAVVSQSRGHLWMRSAIEVASPSSRCRWKMHSMSLASTVRRLPSIASCEHAQRSAAGPNSVRLPGVLRESRRIVEELLEMPLGRAMDGLEHIGLDLWQLDLG